MTVTVLLYDLSAEDAASPSACRANLSAAERDHFGDDPPPHKHASLVARALLRSELGRRLACPPARVPIERNAQGKPYLSIETDWQFNVAHSGQYVALAFSRGGPVGIDIEYRARGSRIDGIARHFFGSAEWRALHASPAERRRYRFFQLWTLKEAMAKALGKSVWTTLSNAQWTGIDGRDPAVTLYDEAAPADGMAWWHMDLGGHYSLGVVQLGEPNIPIETALLDAQGNRSRIECVPDITGASQAPSD